MIRSFLLPKVVGAEHACTGGNSFQIRSERESLCDWMRVMDEQAYDLRFPSSGAFMMGTANITYDKSWLGYREIVSSIPAVASKMSRALVNQWQQITAKSGKISIYQWETGMKILMVTRETQADKRYGLGRSLSPLIDEFRRRGVVVDYICQDMLGARALLWQHRLHNQLSSLIARYNTDTDFPTLFHVVLERLNMGRAAAKFAARHKHTHVHCHDPIIAAGFRFFSRFYPGYKPSWGVTEHGFGSYAQAIHEDGVRLGAHSMLWMRRWEAHTLRSAFWVVSPTRSAMEQLACDLDSFPMPSTWHHIYHAQPAINHYACKEARQLLNWKDDVFYVLGVGRIAPVKQFPMLIQACAGLTKQSNVQLVILGEGDHDNLREIGKQFGLVRETLFATTEDIGLYLSAADVYVSTSASESFGLANLEAMVAGVAIICTAVGGVPEVVGDGAMLVQPGLEAFTTALQQLMNNEELRKTIEKNGRTRAEAWPDIVEITNKYETIYR